MNRRWTMERGRDTRQIPFSARSIVISTMMAVTNRTPRPAAVSLAALSENCSV